MSSIFYTDHKQTPRPGVWADFTDVAIVPLDKHEYFEERDFGSGYWVYGCYTCNRYFRKTDEHDDYFHMRARQYTRYLENLEREENNK